MATGADALPLYEIVTLGLTDAEHTRSTDGYQYSRIDRLAESGHAAGTSFRFSGAASTGISAWLYDGSSTTRLGYFDADHTRIGGYQSSTVKRSTELGYVARTSDRRTGG